MAPKSYLLAAGLLSAATNATATPRAPILPRQTNNTTTDIFAHVTPSAQLEWHDCYEKSWKCAYLTVPLDYENATAGTTDVAFMRYIVREDAEDIVFNPGGPGGSGVDSIQSFAESWAKHWPNYNFVSFDPRGVGRTKPVLTCGNVTDEKLRQRRAIHIEELRTAWDTNLENNEACSAANEHTNVKYVGTMAVVQDIIHFTELQAAAKGKDPKKALVNYYGVSYGTLIGQTLVATYPDRIRRALVDGNVYGVAHYQGWEPSGTDDYAHGIWIFTQICYHAGEELCDLARGAKSAEEVKLRFDTVVAKLADSPVMLPDGTPLTQTAFLSQIEQLMYQPRSNYAALANITMTLYNAKTDHVAKMMKRETPEQQPASAVQIVTSIDIAGRFPWKTFEEFEAAALRLYNASEYHGVFYSRGNGLNGLGATILPPPSQFFPGFKHVTPSANVLFINTAGDPVTPASSCRQMSPYFAGSGIVIIEGPGHGFQAAPSKCAQDLVAKYWADGTVPDAEVRCTPDVEAAYYFGAEKPDWAM